MSQKIAKIVILIWRLNVFTKPDHYNQDNFLLDNIYFSVILDRFLAFNVVTKKI